MDWTEAIGGIGSVISAPINYHFQKKRDERQFQHSKEMSEYAYSKDLEQWERANLYNAPTQQMQRLRDAGLNPAMIYGSGGAKTQTATTLPKYQAPRPDYRYGSPIDPTEILGQYQNFRRQNAEIDLVKEQAKKAKAEAKYADPYYLQRTNLASYQAQDKMIGHAVRYGLPDFYDLTGKRKDLRKTGYQREFELGLRKSLSQIDFMDTRKEMTDKQIEWYLWSNFGSLAVGAAKSLIGGVKGIAGRALKKGWRDVYKKGKLIDIRPVKY